ncbi:VOC family protein [Altererythrobacter sp. MF3-039]|uniref:VOC family protein n=1 Tax=Altererythrobacter sp. MF3-039 TaxID=3252901 RepID=UPI00390C730C
MASDNPLVDLWIDHLGLAVRDVAPVVAALRNDGLKVSDPVELRGTDGPMGQVSAHCVFENFYLEISAPIKGHDNHLWPILEDGACLGIIVMQCDDATARQAALTDAGIACGPVNDASRTVALKSGDTTARFRWFPIEGLVDRAIIAEVEHRNPETVFASELGNHANGARRVKRIAMGSDYSPLARLAVGRPDAAPEIKLDQDLPPRGCTIVTDTGTDLLKLTLEACG